MSDTKRLRKIENADVSHLSSMIYEQILVFESDLLSETRSH